MYNDFDEYREDYINIPSYRDKYDPTSYALQQEEQSPKNKFSKKPAFKKIFMMIGAIVLTLGIGFSGGLLANTITGTNAPGQIQTAKTTANAGYASTNSGGGLTVAQIASSVADSVVEITTSSATTDNYFGQFVSQGAGSGVILTSDGYIVTCNHVIDGANKITVRLKNSKTYSAKVIGTDEQTDIAVLKVDATNLTPAVCGDSNNLQVGELAVAIGNPLGELGGTVTDGIISALNREISINGETMNLLQTNAAINPGNSGGGLFNNQGQLIGITNAKSYGTDIEGLGFAIPINLTKDIANELIDHGYVSGRPVMGVTLVDVTTPQKAMMYNVNELGVYVYSVNSGGPAAKAGMKVGDLLISVNGSLVAQTSDATSALNKCKVDQAIKVVVERDGVKKTLNLTLGEYKPS